MPTLFAAILLLFPYMATFSAATELLPAVQAGAEQRSASVRGLLDLGQRQGFCPPPRYTCESNYCCPDCMHSLIKLIDGGCCSPNTYCVLASNGKIGCCPDGKVLHPFKVAWMRLNTVRIDRYYNDSDSWNNAITYHRTSPYSLSSPSIQVTFLFLFSISSSFLV
ncbi:hypothetical protein CVT25_003909 [Psilocybe cyanescens]|uniref:Granulins domain-containing protein n=1 Tax=Psilocybe cyanescens TaxID=93625 RepID=A0A409XKV1_PSICY|nr:hypothetical protein CVT25_003909 [Psilocybe cyanescens]